MRIRIFALGFILSLWSIRSSANSGMVSNNQSVKRQSTTYTLPVENKVPLTLEGFCLGIPNVTAISSQEISQELGVLCDNGAPTAAFQEIYSNPYQGTGNPANFIVNVPQPADLEGQLIQIYITYAVKVPKNTVPTIIAEEPIATIPYRRGILRITPSFLPPPENIGDADTSFLVQQMTDVSRNLAPRVVFSDVSTHRLNMYRLHPNNFDFFLAARTLTAPSEQFKHANVVRGVMADPENPENSTYVFSVVNVIMNSRGDPNGQIGDGMRDTFFEFFRTSISDAFAAQTR